MASLIEKIMQKKKNDSFNQMIDNATDKELFHIKHNYPGSLELLEEMVSRETVDSTNTIAQDTSGVKKLTGLEGLLEKAILNASTENIQSQMQDTGGFSEGIPTLLKYLLSNQEEEDPYNRKLGLFFSEYEKYRPEYIKQFKTNTNEY